ncbi:hypothetical protein [Aeoliella sp. SH292]|uniref:hypothetical protein n=1 Tax=Aeoliella sp. SH292 TaxID=3454464 RepID=UPI003F95A7C3
MRANLLSPLLVLLALAVSVGCSRGPETAMVAGAVSLDGKPLDDARVEFDHGDGTPPTTLLVTQGQFNGEVKTGKKIVRFFALRPSKPNPRLGPSDVQNPFDNILPDKYGYDSDLALEVGTGSATEELKFDLKSK